MILIESKPAIDSPGKTDDLDESISIESPKNSQDTINLEILNKCHLLIFPKKNPVCDDDSLMRAFCQIVPILSGEYICFIGPGGKHNHEILALTNYRLFLLMNDSFEAGVLVNEAPDFKSFINVPIMMIESIEIREILYIYVYLKNAKTIRLTFSSAEKAFLWSQRINSLTNRMYKLEDLFSFRFYSWLTNESKSDDTLPTTCHFAKNDSDSSLIYREFKRMKFDTKLWRMSEVNKKFELCPSYPESLIVPKSITDEQLRKIACFRSSKRFPTVTWRSRKNGAVLARSSQPNVGLLAWRLNEDELLLKAIAESCDPKPKEQSLLLIIDARFRSVALANRVKGGGYEYTEYYTNCEIQFMNLENIHVIRSSFQSLRLLCQTLNENRQFLSQLETTKWLQHLSGIIKAAITVTSAVDQDAKPVLIHCSDGWDRTPQILALAKLLLDPYYRTISGFRTLIEIDWLQFGHKFAQRNGHCTNSNDTNERCPVFLQWLDCVYQIARQYPSAFQFNETFLLKLCFHSYSCLFGTFLCDSNLERVNEHTNERTFSIWSYLNDKNSELINHLYDDTFDEVIYPLSEICHMQLWHRLFCESDTTYLVKMDRKADLHLNDSLDSNVLGSSPLDQPAKEPDDVHLAKLTPDSSVSSTSSSNSDSFKINNVLLKNAINDTTSTCSNLANRKNHSFDNLLSVNTTNCIKKRSSEPNLICSAKKEYTENKVQASQSVDDAVTLQNSTDTIKDEFNSRLNMIREKELSVKIESSECESSSSSEIEESASVTSTSSSTIPSPSSVQVSQFNSVSTSTSGLSDFIQTSAKSAHIDRLKTYVNSSYDFIFNSQEPDENNENNVDSTDSLKAKSVERKSSKSIPILNGNRSKRPNEKRNSKKMIKDLLDVDGLTKIEDNSFRKIIEQDEKNRRQIESLKGQVQRFKWFFNKLASNPILQDLPLDFQFNNEFCDLTNNCDDSFSNRNQSSQCYSLNNDSVCSSWDEINESDYKLTAWVPDYSVTHCQKCNQKFSYRLRKHHCRNCGNIFCYKCASNYSPLPNNNLFEPVRVCSTCESLLDKQKYNSPTSSTPPTNGKLGFFLGTSRCNQIESGKFKKSDSKSQKVSV